VSCLGQPVPWLGWLVTGLSPWRHRSDPGLVHVRLIEASSLQT